MSKATENELSELHGLIARGLAEKIRNNTASASDYSNAIKFLKDNGIDSDGTQDDAVQELVDEIPDEFDAPSYAHQ